LDTRELIGWKLKTESSRAGFCVAERGSNEGSGIGKEDLREVQSDYAPRRGACDLRKRKAQAAPGISGWRK